MVKTSELGNLAENYAVKLLESKDYKIIDRNFRSRFGEIDIVAINGPTLVFVEVKARWSRKFGAPEEAVTKSKLFRIQKTGEYYALLHPGLPVKLRIDVVSLEIEGKTVSSAKVIQVY
ncbi:MAG: YraN family protein [Candidatus Woesebacteria bacterium]|nr:MAG: YraN family protein [Candidatus Woesebacteria bacterium]